MTVVSGELITLYGGLFLYFFIGVTKYLQKSVVSILTTGGPRPDSAFYLSEYTDEERVILNVRPGITGYNQAISRNAVGTKEKLKNDIYYVEHMSFFLDIKIIFMTIKSVLFSKNVYRDESTSGEVSERTESAEETVEK